jgi:hypothetical protein
MNQVGTYNFRDYQVSRFYYIGTSTLVAGQALCFKSTPTTISSSAIGTGGFIKAFPFDVDLPTTSTTEGPVTGNMRRVAGIVAPQSVGLTGPCFVDVIVPRPGDILQVLVGGLSADLTANEILQLDFSINTGGGSTQAAFDLFTVASSTAYNATQLAVFVKLFPLAQALESLASTLAGSTITTATTRQLVWVKFV